MIILSAKDLTKTYGIDVILQDVSFHVNEGDRIGVGVSGGKDSVALLAFLAELRKYNDKAFDDSQQLDIINQKIQLKFYLILHH